MRAWAEDAPSPRSPHQPGRSLEGVKSCASITELAAKHQIEMPIVENVAAVIAELTPAEMITTLMSRSAKPERY